ncbi:hypothetical protein EMIT0158MI4_280003 [Burkholderia ambifaria]
MEVGMLHCAFWGYPRPHGRNVSVTRMLPRSFSDRHAFQLMREIAAGQACSCLRYLDQLCEA